MLRRRCYENGLPSICKRQATWASAEDDPQDPYHPTSDQHCQVPPKSLKTLLAGWHRVGETPNILQLSE